MSFQLSPELDGNKVFLVNWSELEGRLDCDYYIPALINKIERIKKVPHLKLREIINELQTGYNNKQNHSAGLPFLRTQNIRPIWLDTTNTTFTDDKTIRKSIFGDLLFTRSGVNVGDVGFNDIGNVAISDNVILARFNNHEFAKFCAIFLDTNIGKSFIEREKRDTARAIISYENIENILIPKLQSNIQLSVINKMDTAYAAKKQKEAEAQQLLDSIDDYLLGELGIKLPEQEENTLQSRMFTRQLNEVSGGRFDANYFQEYYREIQQSLQKGRFSCETIKNVTDLVINGNTPASNDYSDKETRYPIIKVKSYQGDFVSLEKLDFTKVKKIKQAKQNDIFILSAAHQASYVGRFIKFLDGEPTENTSFVGELICVRVDDSICNPMYLFSLLNTEAYKVLLNREKTGQTSHIYPVDIKHIKLPVPPIKIQTKLVDHIIAIRKQAKQLQQQAKEELQQAKKEVETMILGEDKSMA